MQSQSLQERYLRGKQTICLIAIVASVAGFVLDAITYQSIYSNIQIWIQSLTVVLCLVAFVLMWVNRDRYYVLAFGLVSYGIIVNIFLTTVFIHTFKSFERFTEANILSRDIFFIILYIVLSGFILGKVHIFIQGLIVFGLLLDIILIKQDEFFVANSAIYIAALVAFLLVLHFFVGILNRLIEDLTQSNALNNSLRMHEQAKNERLIQYKNTLLKINKDQLPLKTELNELFEKLCSAASITMGSSRVSIWLLEDSHTKLVRNHLYEMGGGNDDKVVLLQNDFPNYFKALQTSSYISANNAQSHPATSEFADIYLKPLAIFSMLDCPITIDGATVGVICCEHQHEYKDWTTEDVLFVQFLSEQIAMGYKNQQIKNLLAQLQKQNYELIEKTNEIEAMNEELSSINEELGTLNESLDATVKQRTEELELQNKQLTEYAFINSHLLRAPLARILGLSKLIAVSELSADKALINGLIASSEELDNIIKRISDILYDGNNLSRADVKAIIDKNLAKN